MKLLNTETGRYYQVIHQGKELLLPSVTTILQVISKPWLVPWAVKECCTYLQTNLPLGQPLTREVVEGMLQIGRRQHEARLEEASSFGVMAHDLIEKRLEEDSLPDLSQVPEPVRACVLTFHQWWQKQGLHCLHTEQIVYSASHSYAGTLDCLASRENGDLVVLDWKTSSQYSPEYALQIVAYKMALLETSNLVARDAYIVRIGRRDAAMEVIPIPEEDHQRLFRVFLAARDLFEWQQAKQ